MNVAGNAVERAGRPRPDAGLPRRAGASAPWLGAGLGALAARAGLDPAIHFAIASVVRRRRGVVRRPALPDAHEADEPATAEGEHHVPGPTVGVR